MISWRELGFLFLILKAFDKTIEGVTKQLFVLVRIWTIGGLYTCVMWAVRWAVVNKPV